jgi:uncharacterized protein with HEPN domain
MSDIKRLNFILEKIKDLNSFKDRYSGNIYALLNDKMGFDAVLMCLLQIGETLNKLDNTYAQLSKEDIKGAYDVRNFIAHDYEGVNKTIIEDILRTYIDKLENDINEILKS